MNIVNAVNRWRSGKEIPRLAPLPTVIITFSLLVCALPFGTGFSKWSCAAATLVGIAFLLFMAKSVSTLVSVIVPSLLLFLATGSLLLPTVLICITVTVGAGAFIVNGARSYALLLLLPAAYGISLIVGKDWRVAFLCAVCLPALIALSRASYSGASRLNAICRTSLSLAASAAILTAVLFLTYDLDFAIETLRVYIDALRDSLTVSLRELMLAEPELYGDITETASQFSGALFSLIPALTVCIINYLAFTAQKIHTSLMRANGFSEFVSKKSSEFVMSPASGLFFAGASAVVVLCAYLGGLELMETAENLMVILIPGLSLVGAKFLFGDNERRRPRVFLLCLVGFLLLTYTSAGLIILSSVGAYASVKKKEDN